MSDVPSAAPRDRVRDRRPAPVWLRTAHVLAGVPVGLLAVAVLGGLIVAAVVYVRTVVVPVLAFALVLWLLPRLTGLQRYRFAAFLGVEIPPVPTPAAAGDPWWWLVARVCSGSTWRQVGYHLIAPLISLAGFAAMAVAWVACLVSGAFAVQVWAVDGTWRSVPFLLLTLALSVVGPWLARGVADLDRMAAEALLGPGRNGAPARRAVRRGFVGGAVSTGGLPERKAPNRPETPPGGGGQERRDHDDDHGPAR